MRGELASVLLISFLQVVTGRNDQRTSSTPVGINSHADASVDELTDQTAVLLHKDANSRSLLWRNPLTGESGVYIDESEIHFDGDYDDFWVQPSASEDQPGPNVLFSAFDFDVGSKFFHVYIADYEETSTVPLVPLDEQVDMERAEWSPSGDAIVYVESGDLFLWRWFEVWRITETGQGRDVDRELWNGVAKGIYAEAFLGSKKATWFSPDGLFLAFLQFNSTSTSTFYNAVESTNLTSPKRYVTTSCYPSVSLLLLNLALMRIEDRHPSKALHEVDIASVFSPDYSHELGIMEVVWITDTHEHLLVKTMDQERGTRDVLVDVLDDGGTAVTLRPNPKGEMYYLNGNMENGGNKCSWIQTDHSQGAKCISTPQYNSVLYANKTHYVSLSSRNGHAHLYLFSIILPKEDAKPLTSGQWDIQQILQVDEERKDIWFMSTELANRERKVLDRFIYKVNLERGVKTTLATVGDGTNGYQEIGDEGIRCRAYKVVTL